MRRIHNFGVILKNNKGIVSKLTKKIYEKECNILNSNMCKLGNHFAIDISYEAKKNINLMEIVESSNFDNKNIKVDNLYKLKVYCSDNSGIISTTSEILDSYNCDIIKLNSHVTPAPMSSIPIFTLEVDFYSEEGSQIELFKTELEKKLEIYNCEIEYN